MYRAFKILMFLGSFLLSGVIIADTCTSGGGFRVFSEYRQDGFSNVSGVRNWCQGHMDRFGLGSDRFDESCWWSRSGSYGRYTYSGVFQYVSHDYPGNPQFYLEPYCD
jgi:hypothetical protein